MTANVTWKYFFVLFVVASGSSFQFYSFGVVNPPQAILENWINETYFHRNGVGFTKSGLTVLWSFTAASMAIGGFLGSLLTRTLAETCGRRNGLIVNGVVNVVGALCELLAKYVASPELLIVGRVLLGSCMGIASGIAPMYMMEISPVEVRGAAGTVHMIAVAFGDWFSLLMALPSVLGSEQLWPFAFAFPGLPALIMVMVLPFVPKSPRYTLITLGDRDAAEKAVNFFTVDEGVSKAVSDLNKESLSAKNNQTDVHLSQLFRTKYLRLPLLISILVMVAQQFTGCAALFAYSTNIFMEASLSAVAAQYATVGVGICYFVFVLPSPYLIERLGRRFLSLFQLTGCLVSLALLSILIALQLNTNAGAWTSYGCIAALLLYMAFYGLGSPIPWLITNELFAQEYRSVAVSMSTFVAWFLAAFISIAYLPFKEMVGTELSFLPFIAVLVAAIIVLAILLPETKNKPINEIVSEFKQRARYVSETVTNPKKSFSSWQSSQTLNKRHPELQGLIEEDGNALSSSIEEDGPAKISRNGITNYGAM